MTETSPRLRILLIGAGRRIQNNFLPALTCLADRFEIIGIHARTAERMAPLAAQWNIPAIADLAAVDWQNVDVVAISVPTHQNAVVMRQLLPHAAQLTLMIDTPIFRNARELAACDPLLAAFKQVRIAEDFMNFPPYQLLHQAVAAGHIGTPRSLTLLNTGYLYHGLALIRSFVGFAPVLTSRATGGLANHVRYRFANGFFATVTGPYRQFNHGGVVLEGSTGIITEVAADSQFHAPHGRLVYHLEKHSTNGTLTAYSLMHEGNALLRLDIPDYGRMAAMDFADKSELNLLRGCGLINVFRSCHEANINQHYGFEQALYDSMITRLAERRRFPIDPFALAGKNMMPLLRWLAKILRRS